MLIAIDIGNTAVHIGFFKKGKLRTACQLESRLTPKLLQYKLTRILKQFRPESVEAVVICSVVPRVLGIVERVTNKVLRKRALVVGRDIHVPIKNRYANPRQVGQDRLVCAYAAAMVYGAPAVVIDLGTAITVDVISKKKEYGGGIIIPGLRLSAESLFQKTALLPMVEIKKPASLIGKDTQGSILSGLFYGYGQMLQGLVGLLKKKIGGNPKVVITGGYANLMRKFIFPKASEVDEELVFKGIYLCFQEAKASAKVRV